MDDQVVVLGAGKPHRGKVPSALRTDREGTATLEWLVDALSVELDRITFVGGYDVDAIRRRYPRLRVVVPPDWWRTGSAASLLAVPLDDDCGALIAYSDILVRPQLVDAVRGEQSDIALAWDSRWRHRFAGRQRNVLAGREKVIESRGEVVGLGVGIEVERASGEFVGLVRLSSNAVRALALLRGGHAVLQPAFDAASLEKAHLSGLIEALRTTGLGARGVDVEGDWAEIDEPADIARFVLGTKAETLARLRRTMKSARIADQVTRTVSEWEKDPDRSTQAVAKAFGDRSLIVRSSTTHEDAFSASNAGGFTSVLGVSVSEGLLPAVGAVAESYRQAGIDADVQQVLVQPLVDDVVLSGVALTRTLDHGAPWFVIQYTTDGDTEAVTSGSSGDLRTLMVRRALNHPVPDAAAGQEADRLARLLAALREVEGLLGHDGLDVEFALDRMGEPHILQVRPLVTASAGVVRDADFAALLEEAHSTWRANAEAPDHLPGRVRPLYGVMPDWNPAEIIGTSPGRLALDLYDFLITREVWATARAEAGYRDVRPAPLLVTFAGRPYVDVRASFASFLPRGLDEGLAGRLLGAALDRLVDRPELHDKVEFSVIPTCVDPDWQRWDAALASEGFTRGEIDELRSGLRSVSSSIMSRVGRDIDVVRGLEERTAVLAAREKDPLDRAAILLRAATRWGTLPFAHLARAAFVAVSLLRGAESQGLLSADAVADFHRGIRTVSHDLGVDAAAVAAGHLDFDALVFRWGHLRPGTYEVTSLRYDADPDRFLRPLVSASTAGLPELVGDDGAWRRERGAFLAVLASLGIGDEGAGIEQALRMAIEGREWAKLAFSRNLSDALELIARAWEDRGVAREIVADAPLALLLRDTTGQLASSELIRERASIGASARRLTDAVPLPNLLTVESDLDVFVLTADTPNFVGTQSVLAPILTLDGDSSPTAEVRGRIVCIPRADPGFDWLFGHSPAGLVTLYGGANSHMAIRAAEFGLPAAIGVGEQRYREVATALEVELDPRGRTLRAVRR
jgi:choline kinase